MLKFCGRAIRWKGMLVGKRTGMEKKIDKQESEKENVRRLKRGKGRTILSTSQHKLPCHFIHR